jgi:hypothetical protein
LQIVYFSVLSINSWLKVLLEIRRKGIVRRLRFWPWEQIEFCCRGLRFESGIEFRIHGAMVRSLNVPMSPDVKELVLKELASFVEIRDYSGEVLSKPTLGAGEKDGADVPQPPKIKYSFLQYDLRTLLLLILVVASFSSWYGVLFRQSEETAAQILRLQKKFEAVECHESRNKLVFVDFGKHPKKLTDDDLLDLESCFDLQSLNFADTTITDDGLARLEKLTNLTFLQIPGNEITDAGLAHIARLTRLEHLSVSSYRITDAGLQHLKGLKRLRTLYLYSTSVTRQGIADLQKEMPATEVHY